MSRISKSIFRFGDQRLTVTFERHSNREKLDGHTRAILHEEVDSLLARCWGSFPTTFIEHHIFGAGSIMIARTDGKCIGFCVTSMKVVLGFRINYVEFLIIDPSCQKNGLGSYMFFLFVRREILRNLIRMLLGNPMEIVFITPNIRVISRLAKFASFIYPNPYESDISGAISPADNDTWGIAQELVKNSDNPGRRLEREGLVLRDSYAQTPWLIYNNDSAPWHYDEKMNVFARRYLRYHKGEDREFVVRAHLNFFSVMRYLLHL